MLMQDINNMPLFWGECQVILSSGQNHDTKSDIKESTFKNCEHKQFISSEDIRIFNEQEQLFLEISFERNCQIYSPKREYQQNPNRSFREQIQNHGKTHTGLGK